MDMTSAIAAVIKDTRDEHGHDEGTDADMVRLARECTLEDLDVIDSTELQLAYKMVILASPEEIEAVVNWRL